MSLIIKPGRERSILQRHPWIFESAIAEVKGSPGIGDTVDIYNNAGELIAKGAYSPQSKIRARVWTWDPEVLVNEEFFYSKINNAIERRKDLPELKNTNSYRLISAEADGLPGLIVDKYADTLVFQCLTCGVEKWRKSIIDILSEICGAKKIFERSDSDIRNLEGLTPRKGFINDNKEGTTILINENELLYLVDIMDGHKTGFYLDQRLSRLLIRSISENCKVLDCFSYTGGFSISALYGGASQIIAIETSENGIQLAKKNIELNNLAHKNINWLQEDVFTALRTFRDRGDMFDLIILDPPKFAPTISQVDRAARGYKDINLLAFKLLKPDGRLLTFSCSGGVSLELFRKIVFSAAIDANVDAQILEILFQARDHPIVLNFPESFYLKGLLLRRK